MPRKRHKELREATFSDIKASARMLMADKGTAGLSMRAIARELEMTAPALYYYYASLNDLITDLIVDAFTALADTLETATDGVDSNSAREKLTEVAHTNRNWALAHPTDFQLIYGNPIPGYEQPTEVTYPPARRSFALVAGLFAQAIQAGELVPAQEYVNLPIELDAPLQQLTEHEGHDLPHTALYLAAVAWSRMHGIIMLELFNLIQPVVGNTEVFFQHEIESTFIQMGFQM